MEEILKYFPNLNAVQIERFTALQDLYEEWNMKINVVSRKRMEHLYIEHVLHSLSIAKFIHFKQGSKILDIGTGGGFPGIPLAIFFPEVEFTLVDSIGKKIKVVEEVSQSLILKNVYAEKNRAENVSGMYDFSVTRAVAPMSDLVGWSQSKIANNQQNAIPNGLIALKGGDLKDELSRFKNKVEVVPISQYFDEAFFETKKIVYLPL